MPSKALTLWDTTRSDAMDRMERVHRAVTGGLAGRPRDVTELNHALFLRLAGEVQGFCRDLHDESIDAICTPAVITQVDLMNAFRANATTGRKLDTGNAGPSQIAQDWTKLGMQVWPALYASYPSATVGGASWNARLEWLNAARNGIAHNDVQKIQTAHNVHVLTLNTFRLVRGRLSVTGAYLTSAIGSRPWH
jgi:hypothetical protein